MSPLAELLVAELSERPRHFGELVEAHMQTPWREFLLAWGEVRAAALGRGGLPTTAKIGIDATIPEGVPRSHYERLRYFAKDAVRLEDYR